MYRFFFLNLILFILFKSSAQEITILSSTLLTPVEDVAVFNRSGSFATITGPSGKVVVLNLKQNDTLHFQHFGFHPLQLTLKQIAEKNFRVMLQEKVLVLGDFVIAASKTKEKIENVSHQIDVIKANQIRFSNAPTSAQVLENTGNIFVQRSQMGAGSPVLRGFEANKILLVIDGVRLNNAIYRSGHLQNSITIDEAMVERVEVVYGPGSLIYGSDALGGVMHFFTKKPQLSENDSLRFIGNGFLRFASANLEKTAHVDLNIGGRKIAALTSITFSDFDDLRMGSYQNPFYEDHGKRYEYAKRISGKDSIVENENPLIQRHTAYWQIDLLQKFLIPIGKKVDLGFNFQFSTTSNIPRYDALRETEQISITKPLQNIIYEDTVIVVDTVLNVERLRWARWDYGPQTRFLGASSLDLKNDTRLYNSGQIIVAYQKVFEQRITRRFGNEVQIDRREDVDMVTLNADFLKNFNERNSLQYGIEGTFNNVSSTASANFIEKDSSAAAFTRYPEDGSRMHTYSAYVKFKMNAADKVVITPGIRYSHILLNAKFSDTDFFEFDFSEININAAAFSGLFGVVVNPGKNWNINFLASSGYRAPNVDDVGKIFSPEPGIVIVPNKDLSPEYAYNVEVGISKRIGDKVKVDFLVYNTLLVNAMVHRPYRLNNSSVVIYEGEPAEVYANVNIGRAVIRGFSANLEADITQNLAVHSDLNLSYGRDLTNNIPLAHIPPLFGQTGFISTYGKFKGELLFRYQGWKRAEDFSPSGEDNLQDATEFGAPAWFTIDIRSGYQFTEHFRLQLALENILDRYYRTFASGVSAPGINLIVTAKVSF